MLTPRPCTGLLFFPAPGSSAGCGTLNTSATRLLALPLPCGHAFASISPHQQQDPRLQHRAVLRQTGISSDRVACRASLPDDGGAEGEDGAACFWLLFCTKNALRTLPLLCTEDGHSNAGVPPWTHHAWTWISPLPLPPPTHKRDALEAEAHNLQKKFIEQQLRQVEEHFQSNQGSSQSTHRRVVKQFLDILPQVLARGTACYARTLQHTAAALQEASRSGPCVIL